MEDLPSHWRRLTDRGFDLPVAIFDLDGVLADASHRQHHLAADPPDWDGFGRDAHRDRPIGEGTGHLERLRVDHHITVVTARPAEMADRTAAWFEQHEIVVDLTVFRPDHDRRSSQDVKRDELDRIRSYGGDVRIVYEDDPENVAMYEAEGLAVVYIHSGYYEQGKAEL